MLTLFAFIIVFGILVFVHELGHFLMARKLGIKVEEFGFGFPPRIWSKRRGDTLYSINLIPIGGFVRMYGEHGEGEKSKESYASKPKLQKSLVLVAGVMMNFFLAVLLLTFAYGIGMRSEFPGMEKHFGVVDTQKAVVKEVKEGSPAAQKLEKGDIISKIEGKEVSVSREIFSRINEVTKDNKEKPVQMSVIRDGVESVQEVSTYEEEIDNRGEKIKVRMIGISLETEGNIKAPLYLAPIAAFSETLRLGKITFFGMMDFFSTIATKFTLVDGVGGPVAIWNTVGAFAEMGIMPLIQFMAILSISLAVINIMPIPALDGGHLLILLVERIKGRDLSHEAKNVVQFVGFVTLILLMLVITVRDVTGVSVLESVKGLF